MAKKNFQTVSNNMLVNNNLLMQNQNLGGIRIGKKRPMTTKNLSGAAVISQKKMQLLSYGAGGSNKQSSQSGAFLFKNKKRDKSGGESEEGTNITCPIPQTGNT